MKTLFCFVKVGVGVVPLDDTGRQVGDPCWLPEEETVLRQHVLKAAVTSGASVLVPFFTRPGSPDATQADDFGMFPVMAEECQVFGLVITPPLILYEDGSWCSAPGGQSEDLER